MIVHHITLFPPWGRYIRKGCGFMESGLISKKRRNAFICTLLIITSIVLFAGCDPQYGNYPSSKAPIWTCSDPVFRIVYTKEKNGMTSSNAILEWEGTLIEVSIYFQSCLYDVFPKNSSAYEDRLFGGTWEYRGENLILKIEDDYVFGQRYSKLILSPSDLV